MESDSLIWVSERVRELFSFTLPISDRTRVRILVTPALTA